ncbi:Malignant fibrous histiocytoma-amplified sequence 1 [Chlorella vulgaris]
MAGTGAETVTASTGCEDGALTDVVEDLQLESAVLRRQQPRQEAAREQTAVQEECNSPATSIEDLKQAPADTAADGARELVLAVLSTPGPPQLTILGHLEQNDKLNLGATCTSLRLASLTWISEVTVEVNPDKPDVASLAAWLDRHQVQLSVKLDLSSYKANSATCLWTLRTFNLSVDLGMLAGSALAPLATLQHIESLDLQACRLKAVPEQVSALTALTRLDLSRNWGLAGGWQHLLPLTQLQALRLYSCRLTALPEQLAALTALTALDLEDNHQVKSWQHLLPLTILRDLSLDDCSLKAVPQQLSALTALTHLDLAWNRGLKSGWEHLLPLTELQALCLFACGLTAVPQLSALTALSVRGVRPHPPGPV